MNKKLFMGLAVLVFSLALVAGTAFAAGSGGKTIDISTIYMVDSEGSTTQQDICGWNDTPWLYFELPSDAGSNNIVAESWWYDADDVLQGHLVSYDTSTIWQTLGDWDNVKSLDGWTVTAKYTATGPNTNGAGSTGFTVTPEPISTILFLTGGATLGIRRFWKKRMSA